MAAHRWVRCCSPPASPRMTAGLLGVGSEPTYVLGAGAFGVLVGTALLSPVLGRPVLAGLGWVYRRGFGAVGLMAEQNTRRNPRRTAATASALMIGVSLVTMMAVLGASAKASLDKTLAEDIIADYVVSNPVGQPFSGIGRRRDRAGARAWPRSPGCAAPCSRSTATATSPPPSTRRPSRPSPAPRSSPARSPTSTPRRWRSRPSSRRTTGLAVGSTRHHRLRRRREPRSTVVATYVADSVLQSDVTMSLDGFDAIGVPPTDRTVYVVAQPGTDRAALAAGLDAVVADLPTVSVNDQAEPSPPSSAQPIDRLLFIVYALLGLAVVIAVLGIVNTLALSVIERIREIGLLRAVGLSRRQLRTMLRLESVAIALLGAVLGVVVGLAFALALQRSLADDGLDVLAVPGGQLAGLRRSWPAWSGCSRRSGRAAAPPGSTCCAPSPPTDRTGGPRPGSGEHPHRLAPRPRRTATRRHRAPGRSSRARRAPAAGCPATAATTPWNCADAVPVQASWRPVRRASITPTWPSISAEMRATSPAAAAMRSVSTWNCALMSATPFVVGGATVVRPLLRGVGRRPGRPASCPQGPASTRQADRTRARPYDLGVAILIDPPRPEAHGRRWSHLVSDTSLEELHDFARAVGIPAARLRGRPLRHPRGALRGRRRRRRRARRRPATCCGPCRRSGLRMQKRRGDKGVARVRGIRFVDGTSADVDLIRVRPRGRRPRGSSRRWPSCRDDAGDFALVHSVRRGEWGAPGGGASRGSRCAQNAVREVREETGLVVDPARPPPARLRALPRPLERGPLARGARPAPGLRGAGAGPAPGARRRARRHLGPPLGDLGRARATCAPTSSGGRWPTRCSAREAGELAREVLARRRLPLAPARAPCGRRGRARGTAAAPRSAPRRRPPPAPARTPRAPARSTRRTAPPAPTAPTGRRRAPPPGRGPGRHPRRQLVGCRVEHDRDDPRRQRRRRHRAAPAARRRATRSRPRCPPPGPPRRRRRGTRRPAPRPNGSCRPPPPPAHSVSTAVSTSARWVASW